MGYRRHMHLMLHKPAGLLTATTDARQKTVMDLLPEELKRRALGPVGRLDKDVTGLLLLTDDGQLAHRLISPKWTVEKVYLARVEGALDASDIQAFQAGIALSDFTARPARLEILEPDLGRLTLTEGKFHQVKRMFAARGKPVLRLHRESAVSYTHLDVYKRQCFGRKGIGLGAHGARVQELRLYRAQRRQLF